MFPSLFLAALLAIPLPAKPAHYVTDNAGVLPADRAEKLDQKLKVFEQQTSDQVLVYVDKHVPEGTTLEEMSAQAIHEWGVGQAKKDNGVILFVFTDDHKMRIEVGYGLEGSLTDAKSKLITGTIMKPRLRSGDVPGAVEQGVDAILKTIGGESYKGTGHTVAETAVVGPKTRNTLFAIALGVLPFVLFFIVFFGALALFVVIAVRTNRRGGTRPAGSGWTPSSSSSLSSSDSSSSSSWSSSSDSSSSSSSDFSGGGGDGGGGGASDSW